MVSCIIPYLRLDPIDPQSSFFVSIVMFIIRPKPPDACQGLSLLSNLGDAGSHVSDRGDSGLFHHIMIPTVGLSSRKSQSEGWSREAEITLLCQGRILSNVWKVIKRMKETSLHRSNGGSND